jgi:hypothetical protein
MAYLGTKPANQVIDSTLIADGTITPSDLSTGKPVWDSSGLLQSTRWNGTAAQTGSLGSVVERGSNANGEYVKFADGTQICTKKVTFSGSYPPNSTSIITNNTMASSFVGDPAFSYYGEMFDSGNSPCYGYFVSYSENNVFFANTGHRPVNTWPVWTTVGSSTATNGHYKVTAIGRWY